MSNLEIRILSRELGSRGVSDFDRLHLVGCNHGFADGHGVWHANPDAAYFAHELYSLPQGSG